MPSFSKRSLDNLAQCHPDLIRVANEAIKHFDFVVICGTRNRADQTKAKLGGFSKASFGNSPHNYLPSVAFDCVPYPIDWKNTQAFETMATVMLGAAARLGIPLRWGGDWDRDGKRHEKGENDSPHFELHPWRTKVGKLNGTT